METLTKTNLAVAIGKTIAGYHAEHIDSEGGDHDLLTLRFTDKTELKLVSADFEGYRSWILVET